MAYIIRFEKKAVKSLENIQPEQRENIIKSIQYLGTNPRPAGYKKLKGVSAYRIRIGDYRVIYDINDQTITITVLKVGHRKQIYE
jgi:mRNA interferase RelE/StbE